MRLTIHIDTDSAAFDGAAAGPEVARILRDIADRAEAAGADADATGPVRDINGNTVGRVLIYDADDIRYRLEDLDAGRSTYFNDVNASAVPDAVAEIRDGRGRPFLWAENADDAVAVVKALQVATGTV